MFEEEYVDRCDVFEDEGFSGGNLQRPDFKRMMEKVRKHKFKVIFVYAWTESVVISAILPT